MIHLMRKDFIKFYWGVITLTNYTAIKKTPNISRGTKTAGSNRPVSNNQGKKRRAASWQENSKLWQRLSASNTASKANVSNNSLPKSLISRRDTKNVPVHRSYRDTVIQGLDVKLTSDNTCQIPFTDDPIHQVRITVPMACS